MPTASERYQRGVDKLNVAGLTAEQWTKLTSLCVIALENMAPAGMSARGLCELLRENGGRWFTLRQVETALVIHRVPCEEGQFFARASK